MTINLDVDPAATAPNTRTRGYGTTVDGWYVFCSCGYRVDGYATEQEARDAVGTHERLHAEMGEGF